MGLFCVSCSAGNIYLIRVCFSGCFTRTIGRLVGKARGTGRLVGGLPILVLFVSLTLNSSCNDEVEDTQYGETDQCVADIDQPIIMMRIFVGIIFDGGEVCYTCGCRSLFLIQSDLGPLVRSGFLIAYSC